MKAGWKRIEQTILGAVLLCVSAAGLAETLAMPDREALVGEDVVLWGVTDQAGDYTLDCGNGSTTTAPVVDGSYLYTTCNYGAAGTYAASLTVGAESDGVDIAVFDPAALNDFDERGVRIAREEGD